MSQDRPPDKPDGKPFTPPQFGCLGLWVVLTLPAYFLCRWLGWEIPVWVMVADGVVTLLLLPFALAFAAPGDRTAGEGPGE